MKKSSFLIIICFYFLLFLGLGGILWWSGQLQPVDKLSRETVTFVVDKGEGVSEIALRLQRQKLVKDQFSFKLWLLFSGIARKIRAGSYYLSSSMTAKEIALNLTKGSNDRWVTITEGLRAEQIGELLIRSGFAIDPKGWEKEIKAKKLEGQLFPDSYLLPKGATQETILQIIQKNFQKKVIGNLDNEWAVSDKSQDAVLIMASLVEREAKTEKDRALVAGIILKRLDDDWPLQIDATVQYAIASKKCSILKFPCDWWPQKLTKSDLQVVSPYNTYLNQGLPPSPICNPGLFAIKAVLEPSDSPYWYYISGSDGLMHYAQTSEEHVENIRKYIK